MRRVWTVATAVAVTVCMIAGYVASVGLRRDALQGQALPGDRVRRIDAGNDADVLIFEQPSLNLGDLEIGESHPVELQVQNVSQEAVTIEAIRTTCSCLSSQGGVDTRIPPGEEGIIRMELRPKPDTGRWPMFIRVSGGQEYEYVLVGRAYREVQMSSEHLVLGSIVLGSDRQLSVSVLGENGAATVTSIKPSVDWITATLLPPSSEKPSYASGEVTAERNAPYRRISDIGLVVRPPNLGSFHEFVTCSVTTQRGPRDLVASISGTCCRPVVVFPEKIEFLPDRRKRELIVRSQIGPIRILTIHAPELIVETVDDTPKPLFRIGVECPASLFAQSGTEVSPLQIVIDDERMPLIDVPIVLIEDR